MRVGREDSGFAEHVAPHGQPLGRDRRDHPVDDEPHVFLAPPAIVERNLVRPHERGHEIDGLLGCQPANRPQHLQLRVDIEPVAAFDLGGGRAARQHLRQADPRGRDQIFFGRGPRRPDGRHDPAAFGRDLGVGRAAQAPPQLVPAVAGEHRVGMGVDEAGDHREPAPVDDGRVRQGRQGRRQLAVRSGEDDPLVVGRDRAVGDDRHFALRGAGAWHRARAGEQLTDVADDEHLSWQSAVRSSQVAARWQLAARCYRNKRAVAVSMSNPAT
jgi:hypothetical protein